MASLEIPKEKTRMIGMKAMDKDFLDILIPPLQSIIELMNKNSPPFSLQKKVGSPTQLNFRSALAYVSPPVAFSRNDFMVAE
jgi:hypothetical protein